MRSVKLYKPRWVVSSSIFSAVVFLTLTVFCVDLVIKNDEGTVHYAMYHYGEIVCLGDRGCFELWVERAYPLKAELYPQPALAPMPSDGSNLTLSSLYFTQTLPVGMMAKCYSDARPVGDIKVPLMDLSPHWMDEEGKLIVIATNSTWMQSFHVFLCGAILASMCFCISVAETVFIYMSYKRPGKGSEFIRLEKTDEHEDEDLAEQGDGTEKHQADGDSLIGAQPDASSAQASLEFALLSYPVAQNLRYFLIDVSVSLVSLVLVGVNIEQALSLWVFWIFAEYLCQTSMQMTLKRVSDLNSRANFDSAKTDDDQEIYEPNPEAESRVYVSGVSVRQSATKPQTAPPGMEEEEETAKQRQTPSQIRTKKWNAVRDRLEVWDQICNLSCWVSHIFRLVFIVLRTENWNVGRDLLFGVPGYHGKVSYIVRGMVISFAIICFITRWYMSYILWMGRRRKIENLLNPAEGSLSGKRRAWNVSYFAEFDSYDKMLMGAMAASKLIECMLVLMFFVVVSAYAYDHPPAICTGV